MFYNPKIILAFWRDCGLPVAQPEFKFHPARKWAFDFAFLADSSQPSAVSKTAVPKADSRKLIAPLAIEVQGGIWIQGRHSRGGGLVKEYEKMNAAAVLGWRILYCTPQEVGTLQFARTIEAALQVTSDVWRVTSSKVASRTST